ncbi:MAG: alpha/beta fold hydrolase [Thermoanaerobaculia bacterium]
MSRTKAASPDPSPAATTVLTSLTSSADGISIAFDVYEADSPHTVLIVPGFWRDRNYGTLRSLASHLVRSGYRAAILDLRGHGDSQGTFGFNRHEHLDVTAVTESLLASTATRTVTLLGFSFGGAVSISTVVRHDLPWSSLLLVSPVATMSMISPRINPFTIHRHVSLGQALRHPRFEWQIWRGDRLSALEDVASVRVPITLIHARNDWLVGHRHSIALFQRANEPKSLHLLDIPGCYHADRLLAVAPQLMHRLIFHHLETYATLAG